MDGTILGKKYDIIDGPGGGGGTSDYEKLSNLPKINSVELKGNKSFSDLGLDAESLSYDNTESSLVATNVQSAIDEMIVNFQAGVDDVYDACVAKGSTPESHSLSDVVAAIGDIETGGGLTQVNPFGSATTLTPYNANGVTITDSEIDEEGTLNFDASESSAGYEGFVIELDATAGKTYMLEFDLQVADTAAFNGASYRFGYLLGNTALINYSVYEGIPENMTRDFQKHHYAAALVANGSKMYLNFNVCGFSDGTVNPFSVTDFKLYEVS